MTTTIRAEPEAIPVRFETDVLVCGGGPAGTAAAVAAARQGVRVALIERYNHLGGLATGGLVLVLPHFVDFGRQTIGGLGLEIREQMRAIGEAWPHQAHDDSTYFEPEALKWISLRLCRTAGVRLWLHCWLSGAIVEEEGRLRAVAKRPGIQGIEEQKQPADASASDRESAALGRIVRGVVFESKGGRWAALAKIVVDATGDGDIFAWAGAAYEQSMQPVGLPFRVGGLDISRWLAWTAEHPAEARDIWESVKDEIGWPSDMFYIAALHPERGTGWGNNYFVEADGLDPLMLSEIEIQARLKIWEAIQRLKKQLPGWENAWLIDTACQLGVRRSRRLKGVYCLTEQETGQPDYRHPEAIGRGNDFRRPNSSYDIPYGTLVPEQLDGLLTCGRCISCTHEALEPLREIHVCWVTGQAAGVAAAMAVQHNVPPRALDISELQARLRAADVAFADD